MAKVDENYVERLCNAVAKTMVEVIENLTIEDVNMYKVGYNKAIDEFAEHLKLQLFSEDDVLFDKVTLYKIINKIAGQMKGGV